ncbi:hypothetical protein GSI_05333 [Ganoderma sinense ZZ0214-1]|uniref:tripeptidyl-peptidase II n=1 Tax=Ganoderma sinense ZZ0214-1 TaxID=1077348 RepID=A0A2G8SFT8_9APHY|nr:hypothetical protein GSI_05333 [Ganoderma sinense ZZ0214-1]
MPLSLALHPNNKTGLIDTLMDISNPSSVNYGQHLSKSEVNAFVAPSPESVQATMNWLAKYNVTPQSTSPAGDMLHLRVPIATANAMLSANYQAFVHEETGTTLHKTDSYAIPAAMQPYLAFVHPTTQVLPPISKPPLRRVAPPVAAPSISKRKLALYNLPTAPATAPNNSIVVSGFLNEVANQTDLTTFLRGTRPDFPNGTFTAQSLDGGPTTGPGTLEASLDIEYTVGLATNVPVQFISVGSADFFTGIANFLNFLLDLETPPPVLTTSFGANENAVPPEIAEALCFSMAQLGTRGTSILFASGDGGVAGIRPNDTCGDDGSFIPVFPATCPFVTAVGSTEGVSPENAATFSSGGFSNIFPRPDYQAAGALKYLNMLNITTNSNASSPSPLAGRFNTLGRAFPDVAMQGRDIAILAAGVTEPVLGTSASSPMFASMVALINDQLLNAGRPTLGFLNPLLYSNAAAAGVFNDITVGSNVGCGTAGFPAMPGWDAITGLGTPDYVKLLNVAMASNQSSTL